MRQPSLQFLWHELADLSPRGRQAAACLTALIALLFVAPASAEPRAVHTGEDLQASFPNWMRWVPDSVPLSSLSIPGTHDSMAHYGGPLAQTQTMRLAQQLRAGIRTIDIRARHEQDTFVLYHGIVYQKAGFSDVLKACNAFLDQNPSETILLWLSADGVPTPVDLNCTRQYYETFERYRDESGLGGRIYIPNSVPSVQLPLGQVRGKIVIIQGFRGRSFVTPYGYPSNAIEKNGFWDLGDVRDMDEKWEAVLAQATLIGGSDNTRMYEISLSGSSSRGGIWPIDVANGILGEEGIPYRYLRYLFTGNQRRTTGLVYMDFPGSGLIGAIIAHNLRHATNLSAAGSDFRTIMREVTYSAAHEGPGAAAQRAAQLQNFVRRMLPDQRWAALVGSTEGNDRWGFALEPDGLVGQTGGIDGFTHLVVGSRNLDRSLSTLNLSAYWNPSTLLPLTGSSAARAQGALGLLKSQFPNARWNVAVKAAPMDTGNWSVLLDAAVSATTIMADEGWVYSYTAWANTATNQPPVARPGGPYEVNEGSPVTFNAGQSSDPSDDALQYRWDFEGDGEWDTDYSYDPVATHVYSDNPSPPSPTVEVFDGATAVREKVSVEVLNVAPQLGVRGPLLAGDNNRISQDLAFTDPGADTWRVDIEFGDGTPRTRITPASRSFRFDHQFPPSGAFRVRITLRDDDEGLSEREFWVVTGAPMLEVRRTGPDLVQLSWSNHPTPFRLERTASPSLVPSPVWTPVTTSPQLIDGRRVVHAEATNVLDLFRLTIP